MKRAAAINEKALGPEHSETNRARINMAHLLLAMGHPTEALALGAAALTSLHRQEGARVTADALDALGRSEEAKALRERYGVTEPEKPKSS